MERIARIMQSGDEVLTVTPETVVIQRVNGEVDIYALKTTADGIRIGETPEIRIAYEEVREEEYETENHIKVVTF